MSNEKSLQEKTESNEEKFADTQNILKSKFSKAYAFRVENEKNLNKTLQPLFTELSDDAIPISIANDSQSMLSKEVNVSKYHKKGLESSTLHSRIADFSHQFLNDPNVLCDRLRILLSSTVILPDNQSVEEINAIIMQLREQGIIV